MAEPRYKLIYYPFRGRAELLRLIFIHLDIAYEDARIPLNKWTELKPGTALNYFNNYSLE